MNIKKEKILVADDAAIDRRIVKLLLRKDYEIEEAADGLEAVQHLEANPDGYAAILLDMLMPTMDGFQVMAWMREHRLIDRMPVIALTAISDVDGHIKCFESGAIDIVEKPFNEKMLIYKLRFDIDRFRRISGSVQAVPAQELVAAPKRSPLDEIRTYVEAKFGVSDPVELKDFVDTFMESFGECAEELKKMTDGPDPAVIRQVTHKIYGFADAVGATRLNDYAVLLNSAAKQGDPQAMNAGVRLVLELYGECLAG